MQPVLRDDDRDALILQTRQDPDERLRARRVEVGRGLVEHEDPRAARNGGGKCHPLLLPARQLGEPLRQKPPHAAELRHDAHPRDRGVRGGSPVLEREGDLVSDNPHEELASRVLHHHAHALGPLPGRKVEHVRSVDEDGALPLPREEGSRKPVDKAQDSRLAVSRPATDDRARAVRHVERHPANTAARPGRCPLLPRELRLVEVAERHVVQNDRLCSAHKAAPSAYTAAEVATTKKAHATSRTENPTWYTDVRPSPISMPRSSAEAASSLESRSERMTSGV